VEKYPPDTFLVVVYEGDWLVGKVVDKEKSEVKDWGPAYLHVEFMLRSKENILKWPAKRRDILNTLEVS
jgi:hypothetical protein